MRIGFIGIGNMGWPMAGHVAAGGYTLMVHDLDGEKNARFAREHNCIAARSLAEVAENEIIIMMLPTGQDVRNVVLNDPSGPLVHALNQRLRFIINASGGLLTVVPGILVTTI